MVKEEKTPVTEGTTSALPKVDFQDTYAVTNHKHTLEEISHLIFDNMPVWVQALFKLRNFLAKCIGLKTDMPADYKIKFEEGGYMGYFKIYAISENEVVVGADDTHLNFRASIYNSQEPAFNIKVSTLVQYHNFKGKLYMSLIRPFHKWVVKALVKNASTT